MLILFLNYDWLCSNTMLTYFWTIADWLCANTMLIYFAMVTGILAQCIMQCVTGADVSYTWYKCKPWQFGIYSRPLTWNHLIEYWHAMFIYLPWGLQSSRPTDTSLPIENERMIQLKNDTKQFKLSIVVIMVHFIAPTQFIEIYNSTQDLRPCHWFRRSRYCN